MIETPFHHHLGAIAAGVVVALLCPGRARGLAVAVIASVTPLALLLRAYVLLHDERPFGFDLAIVHNALWNLAGGRGPFCDPLGENLYALHAFFHLPLFLPFYLAFDHPVALHAAHLLFGIAAAIPAFLLGRRLLGSAEAGLSIALLYLLHPATSGFLLVECQPSITGPVFLFGYLSARESGRRTAAILLATCAAFGYEPFIAAVLVEGALEIARPRIDRRFGVAVFTVGLAVLGLFLAQRAGTEIYSGSRHYRTLTEGGLGAVPELVFTKRKIGFVLHLLLPTLFVALLAPRLLALAAPEIVLVLLADPGSDMPRIDAFYTHVSVVAVVAAATVGLRILAERGLDPAHGAFALLLSATALQFAYPHTFLPRMLESARAAPRVAGTGAFATVPFDLVPEGARILVPTRSDVVRFPRRRAFTPDDFLSPRIADAFRAGTLRYEYRAVPVGAPWAESGAWERIEGTYAGLEMYRRAEAP